MLLTITKIKLVSFRERGGVGKLEIRKRKLAKIGREKGELGRDCKRLRKLG